MERAVLDIPLLVDVLLAEPKIALKHLIHIKPGDVLPVQLTESVDIRLEENPFFEEKWVIFRIGKFDETSNITAFRKRKNVETEQDTIEEQDAEANENVEAAVDESQAVDEQATAQKARWCKNLRVRKASQSDCCCRWYGT